MNAEVDVDRAVGSQFRATMRRFPATVTLVTACEGHQDHGMTVTAVTSVSMEPPSLLVCLSGRTLLHAMLLSQEHFAVNVLGEDHAALSDAFAGKVAPEERFADGGWERHAAGMLTLPSAHAAVVCRRKAAMPFGTHTIFVGEVVAARLDEGSRPLLYEDARYCTSHPA